MYGLLYKELILNKKQIVSIAAAIVLFSSIMFIPTSDNGISGMEEIFVIICIFFTVLIFAVVGMLQQGIFEIDERSKWQFFITSTPLGKNGQVQVKYIFTFATSLITAFYCILINSIACLAQNTDYLIPSDLIVLITLVQLFMRSIEFPFIFRFGSKYGSNVRMVLVFSLVFVIIVYLLFGDLSVFGSKENFMQWLNLLLNGEAFSNRVLYFIRFLPCITLALYYLSYKISCRLYIKGGDCYDK